VPEGHTRGPLVLAAPLRHLSERAVKPRPRTLAIGVNNARPRKCRRRCIPQISRPQFIEVAAVHAPSRPRRGAVRCVSLDTSSRRVHPSPLSSSPLRPAPPVSARHPHPTALQGAGLLPELLLAALSQTAGFEVLGRPGRAPGTTPVPTLLPRLGVTFHDSVTSLRGSYPRALHRTRWAPTQLQSPRTVVPSSLSGGRTQKLLPYPSVQVLRCSASSLNRVTSKGFLPLS
jgi:hypothetical protein